MALAKVRMKMFCEIESDAVESKFLVLTRSLVILVITNSMTISITLMIIRNYNLKKMKQ